MTKFYPPAPCVVGGVLIIRDLCRHVELRIVDGGLVERGGAHTVPRHIARQAQRAGCAQHGAAASPSAPAISGATIIADSSVADPGFFIPDPTFFHPGSRIRLFHPGSEYFPP
jgi:hypothetical protein